MQFRYRYVPYGTNFGQADGPRQDADDGPTRLHENELVTDVGGTCWGCDGEELPVLDHHFFRKEGQFPSAAAAVLHNAARISERFTGRQDTVWLVSHRDPDFDALTSLYLARRIIEGQLPATGWEAFGIGSEGWSGKQDEINWYRPTALQLPPDRRWAVHLAAEAARVDGGRRSRCPLHRRLHAVLYAAILRGRPYRSETSGACEFYDEVRARLAANGNGGPDPYFDSVLERSELFRPELDLLDREVEAYERDVARAKKLVVYVPRSRVPFEEWFAKVRDVPLLDDSGKPNELHVRPPETAQSAADGIFLRDPESLLFKELARSDSDRSSFGQGFLFTAIAYSAGRSGAKNPTEYFFALDRERAKGRHLYPVWARLQAAEAKALRQASHPPAPPRDRFAGRAGTGVYAGHFDDPWFDGQNYECTITPTPNRGSALGPPGTRADLGDDPVALIVETELTGSLFAGEVRLIDYAAEAPEARPASLDSLRHVPPPRERGYRYLQVGLDADVDLVAGGLVGQLGTLLWRHIDADNRYGVPTDFETRHLVRANDWFAVWNRRGIAVAFKPAAGGRVESLRDLFTRLCRLASEMRRLMGPADTAPEESLRKSEELLAELARLRQELALPEHTSLRRFVEAGKLDEALGMLRDLNAASAGRIEAEQARKLAADQARTAASMGRNVHTLVELQRNVEWVEVAIVVVYFTELLHVLAEFFGMHGRYAAIYTLACASFAGVVAFYGLWPVGNHDNGPKRRWVPHTMALLGALLIGAMSVFVAQGWTKGKLFGMDGWFHHEATAGEAESGATNGEAHITDGRAAP